MEKFLGSIIQIAIFIAIFSWLFDSCDKNDVNDVVTNTGEVVGRVVTTFKEEVMADGDEFAITTSIELPPDTHTGPVEPEDETLSTEEVKLTSLSEARLREMLEGAFLGGVQHQAETANQKGNCVKFGELLVECVNTIELNGETHKIHTECESDPYEETITCKAE